MSEYRKMDGGLRPPLAALLGAPLWLLGLYFASPAIARGGNDAFVDRLRNALIFRRRHPAVSRLHRSVVSCSRAGGAADLHRDRLLAAPRRALRPFREPVPYATIAALALVAWPQLMRPLLDGDSLSYHLPNAASWVQSHGIWTTATRYWWYPPASELFASALYATGGPFRTRLGRPRRACARRASRRCLGARRVRRAGVACGCAGRRDRHGDAARAARRFAAKRRVARRILARIAVAASPKMLQAHGWRSPPARSSNPTAGSSSAIALTAMRARPMAWIAGLAAACAWALHDALLWKSAIVPSVEHVVSRATCFTRPSPRTACRRSGNSSTFCFSHLRFH